MLLLFMKISSSFTWLVRLSWHDLRGIFRIWKLIALLKVSWNLMLLLEIATSSVTLWLRFWIWLTPSTALTSTFHFRLKIASITEAPFLRSIRRIISISCNLVLKKATSSLSSLVSTSSLRRKGVLMTKPPSLRGMKLIMPIHLGVAWTRPRALLLGSAFGKGVLSSGPASGSCLWVPPLQKGVLVTKPLALRGVKLIIAVRLGVV